MSTPEENKPDAAQRIAKVIARAGLASRRAAERMIEEGRVKLNGKTLTTPAITVTDKDTVEVDGVEIGEKEPPRLWRYHKPPGLLTTNNDPKGRATIYEKLPEDLPRVISVGRLDMPSEGLLLLTNDGELARALELPETGWTRRYRARAYGKVDQAELDTLMDGIIIDGVPTGPIEATLESQKGDNAWIAVTIREGKNREVRRAFESIHLTVNRLIRVSYGPFQLGQLARGGVEEVKRSILRDQVGKLVDIPKGRPVPSKRPQRAPKRGTNASSKARMGKPNADKHQGPELGNKRAMNAKAKPSRPRGKSSYKPKGPR